MLITNAEKVIVRVNRAFTKIAGYTAQEAEGQTPSLFSSGRMAPAFYTAMWSGITATGSWQGEVWNRRKNGQVFPAWLAISAVKDGVGLVTHYVAAFSDTTSSKVAEEQSQSLAFSDSLTGLPNRQHLIVSLQQARLASLHSLSQAALLLVDLDRFKNLNEVLGYENGNLLLQQVAKRISACVRKSDIVARLGSDEFIVLLEGLDPSPQVAAGEASAIAEEILATLSQPYPFDRSDHVCTASIGITLLDGSAQEDVDEPLMSVELAMYQAKADGRNTWRFFEPQMKTTANARAALEVALREALLKEQFTLHYQVQVKGQSQIVGAEALVRWQHPQHGLVLPAEFIPLAEETGLILPLGQWVLETACQQLARWATQPAMTHLSLAINVSACQFHQRDFVEQVLDALARSGAPPELLKLELTESMLLDDVEAIIVKMERLIGRGVSFALDDFGTGYSSLSFLKRLPLDEIKIDQGFVSTILSNPVDAAIARMVIALADSLGLEVIAEGVETTLQRDFLAALGCHHYQGYLFGRAMPIREFEGLIQKQ